MVPSFCSPICCLIPGLSYMQDWWCTVKIILHRIISVVWLTNFPSEIRRLTSPRWWAVPLFPEREKARGPALSWEPCIDDRLSLPRASTKEKMPAEWLLYFKMGSLKILLIQCTFAQIWPVWNALLFFLIEEWQSCQGSIVFHWSWFWRSDPIPCVFRFFVRVQEKDLKFHFHFDFSLQ